MKSGYDKNPIWAGSLNNALDFPVSDYGLALHLRCLSLHHNIKIKLTVKWCSLLFLGFLDFPSVDVTAQQDGKVQVRFMHPWLVYLHNSSKANSQKEISHDTQSSKLLPELKYEVIINNNKVRLQSFFF